MTTLTTAIPYYAPTILTQDALPWHPFTPYSDDVQLKILHVDFVKSETVMLLRAPGGSLLGVHNHYGRVLVYTVSGQWRYEEHSWVSGPGDFVYEVADSKHTFIAEPGEDVELFIYLEGAIAFLGEDDSIVGIETAHTFAERYLQHCRDNAIEPVDLTKFAIS
jgi:2,4'-dihydroxyacetophenone dioxygenase